MADITKPLAFNGLTNGTYTYGLGLFNNIPTNGNNAGIGFWVGQSSTPNYYGNEGGADPDMFLQRVTGRLGIGNITPLSKLDIADGDIQLSTFGNPGTHFSRQILFSGTSK